MDAREQGKLGGVTRGSAVELGRGFVKQGTLF